MRTGSILIGALSFNCYFALLDIAAQTRTAKNGDPASRMRALYQWQHRTHRHLHLLCIPHMARIPPCISSFDPSCLPVTKLLGTYGPGYSPYTGNSLTKTRRSNTCGCHTEKATLCLTARSSAVSRSLSPDLERRWTIARAQTMIRGDRGF